jgi:hypothetical protein
MVFGEGDMKHLPPRPGCQFFPTDGSSFDGPTDIVKVIVPAHDDSMSKRLRGLRSDIHADGTTTSTSSGSSSSRAMMAVKTQDGRTVQVYLPTDAQPGSEISVRVPRVESLGHFTVRHPAVLRREYSTKSQKCGKLSPGIIVVLYEQRSGDSGTC